MPSMARCPREEGAGAQPLGAFRLFSHPSYVDRPTQRMRIGRPGKQCFGAQEACNWFSCCCHFQAEAIISSMSRSATQPSRAWARLLSE